jgi:DNA polymerase-3 subunit alpha
MEQIPRYVEGKNVPESIHYETELLRPILEKTYGCMVYQEQVMQIVRDLAGYSLGRSDLVRRAMSKKKHDVMAKEREYFINGIEKDGKVIVPGAVRNGVSRESAEKIFDEMMDFASYAFNKSHAAAYAVLAYRTAYLKLYYPVEFMTALINSFLGVPDKIAEYIYSCGQNGLRILPPDVNRSLPRFSVENGNIRFGLAAVRNVGEGAIGDIIKERQQKGAFADFYDFLRRSENLNKRMVEGLIKSGCFDCFGIRRSQLMAVYESAMTAAANDKKSQEDGQLSLFDIGDAPAFKPLKLNFPEIKEYDAKTLLAMEKEALGIYISGHPLQEFTDVLSRMGASVSDIIQADGTGRIKDNSRVKIGGLVAGLKQKATKSGSGMMGFAVLEDLTGTIELTLFPSVLQKYLSLMEPDSAVCVSGRVNMREDQANTVLVEEVIPLSALNIASKRLFLKLEQGKGSLLPKIKQTLQRYPGNIPVVIYDEESNKKMLVPKEYYVNMTAAFLDLMDEMLGEGNVKTVSN